MSTSVGGGMGLGASASASGNTVPKSITRIREEWNGMPILYVGTVFVFLILTLVLASAAILVATIQWIFIVLILFELGFFIAFLRSPRVMEKSNLMSKFMVRVIRGETLVAKYQLPAGFLQAIIPVKSFHEDGLIEFTGNKYGLLMRIAPARIAEDDIETHIHKTKALVDSLHGDLLIKAYICTVHESDRRPLSSNIINLMNKDDKTKEQMQHLESIYDASKENDKSVIQWHFYIFIGLGTYESINKAVIAKKQYFPGIEAKLQKLNVLVAPIKERNALITAYRKCITQEGYK